MLTFTGNLRGVGQVSFTLDGEPLGVQKGNGLFAEEGQPVSFDDYRELLVDTPSTSTTTTTIDPFDVTPTGTIDQ